MKNRWEESLKAAVQAYDVPMVWSRGDVRKAMIARREASADKTRQVRKILVRAS